MLKVVSLGVLSAIISDDVGSAKARVRGKIVIKKKEKGMVAPSSVSDMGEKNLTSYTNLLFLTGYS